MNSQQAIYLLKDLEQRLDDYYELNDEGKAAFRMAITALELFGNAEQLPSAQPLTEEDYIELHDRFGTWVEEVVRDMISGEGKRWGARMNDPDRH